jgi:alkaline phosphatase
MWMICKPCRPAKCGGLFDDSHMQPNMDRQYFAEHEPSIAEMTQKAIELLSRDRDGFFLMVEGSQVDWAGHNNDSIYMVDDFIAFDDAVKVACDFAEKDGRTLVLAYPDHNTGGMKIGHYSTAVGYTETKIEDLIYPLLDMTITSPGLAVKMGSPAEGQSLADFIEGNQTVIDYWNIDLTAADAQEIAALEPDVGLAYALARVVSKNYTVIGWTTHGHNGETVPLWIYGMDAPAGTIDNTDLAKIAAEALGVDLDKTSGRLYVDLSTVTSAYEIDTDTDPENPVVKIGNVQLPRQQRLYALSRQNH